jgi:hypothetical protein
MTNEERLMSEVDSFREMILGKLADEALDRGEGKLAAGYRWLLEERKWPTRRKETSRRIYWIWFICRGSQEDSDALPPGSLPKSSAVGVTDGPSNLAYFDTLPHALKAAAMAYEA